MCTHLCEKTIAYVYKIGREFLPVEGIQQTEIDMVKSIKEAAKNNPMRQGRLANVTCFKFRQKVIIEKVAPVQLAQAPDQNTSVQIYSLSMANLRE